jgi:hypothetical protein
MPRNMHVPGNAKPRQKKAELHQPAPEGELVKVPITGVSPETETWRTPLENGGSSGSSPEKKKRRRPGRPAAFSNSTTPRPCTAVRAARQNTALHACVRT